MEMRIVDTGIPYGMGTAAVFNAWNPIVDTPRNLKEFEETLSRANLILFGGGQDIHPSLYGHRNTGSMTDGLSLRDRTERRMFELCVQKKIPILGICRGSQLLCALNGGALLQDVLGHGISGTHKITTVEGLSIPMTSTHHQMMFPGKSYHELLAWKVSTSNDYSYDYDRIVIPPEFCLKEPEVVYFPKTNSLAIQGHPEYFEGLAKAVQYTHQLVKQKLFKENLTISLRDL